MPTQMTVTINGIEKKSPNPNAPYTILTDLGSFKVWDKPPATSVVELMKHQGKAVSLVFRNESREYIAEKGPRAGEMMTSDDRIVESWVPAPMGVPPNTIVPEKVTVGQPAKPAGTWKPRSPEETAQIHRQTACKIAAELWDGAIDLPEIISLADDFCHYFEHGRLPELISPSQHKMLEAICGNLDKAEPDKAPWREFVKRSARVRFGHEVAHLTRLRKDEATLIIDELAKRQTAHDEPVVQMPDPDEPPLVDAEPAWSDDGEPDSSYWDAHDE